MCVNNTLQQRQQQYEHQQIDEDDDDEVAALIKHSNCKHKSSNIKSIIDSCSISRTKKTKCLHQQYNVIKTATTTLSPLLSTTATTFNCKYRRKHILLFLLVFFHICSSFLTNVSAYNCTAPGGRCQNDGKCKEDVGQCICADGWQGPECQFCGGKVR